MHDEPAILLKDTIEPDGGLFAYRFCGKQGAEWGQHVPIGILPFWVKV